MIEPIKLSSDEIITIFNSSDKKHYKKKGIFIATPATNGETYLTIVSGKLETLKTAGPNETIIRNIQIGGSAECYIIDNDVFNKRYNLTGKSYIMDNTVWQEAEAKGEVLAFEFSGNTIYFQAPWGEEMICHEGDFIASPVAGKETDVYRIERDTFKQTYFEYTSDQTKP